VTERVRQDEPGPEDGDGRDDPTRHRPIGRSAVPWSAGRVDRSAAQARVLVGAPAGVVGHAGTDGGRDGGRDTIGRFIGCVVRQITTTAGSSHTFRTSGTIGRFDGFV
jgi:hypothetical protein